MVSRLADLRLADDVVLGRVDRDRRAELRDELLDSGPGLAQPLGRDAGGDALAVARVELLGELGVEPLRLAHAAAELLLDLAELDLGVREVEGAKEVLGNSFAPASTIVRPSPSRRRSGRAPSLDVGERGVDDELAVEMPIRTRPRGPRNGSGEIISAAEAPLMAEDVVRGDQICHESR